MTGLPLSLLFGFAHGVSDAGAGFLVGILLQMSGASSGYLIFLYNGLAFGLQPIAGLVIDRLNQPRRFAAVGLSLTAIGLTIIDPNLRLSIALIGIGSAIFHAAGGATAIMSTPQRASGPGAFASFGVIGLVTGMRLSLHNSFSTNVILAIIVFAFALTIWSARLSLEVKDANQAMSTTGNELWIILLVMAFALRSFVWSGVDKSVEDFTALALWLALAAGAGKLVGGFASDRLGWKTWAVGSLTLSLILLVFGQDNIYILLVGVFLLQSVTALTVAAFGRMIPSSPALAASLGFGAAVILGGMPFLFIQQIGVQAVVFALSVSIVGYWLILQKQR